MNKGELIAALAAKTEMTKKDSETALNAVLDVIAESMAKGEKVQLIDLRSQESSCPRCPQPPHRRFCEDRCLQGSRFQGRQGSEGRCEQVILIHKTAAEQAAVFLLPLFKTVAKGSVM